MFPPKLSVFSLQHILSRKLEQEYYIKYCDLVWECSAWPLSYPKRSEELNTSLSLVFSGNYSNRLQTAECKERETLPNICYA